MVEAIGEQARQALQTRAAPLGTAALRALSPLLFIIPHADDEVLGCGGLIAEASDNGMGVKVVYLTDGAASHQGSPSWPPARLARVRRQEALQALEVLGVAARDVLFLDWPDAAPHPKHSQAFARSVDAVYRWANALPPRSIWAPFHGEGHCDHRAAWTLASAVTRLWVSVSPTLFEYLIWGWGEPGLAESLSGRRIWSLSCGHQIARRRRALAFHATQLGSMIDDAVEAFALPASLTALVDCPTQLFVEC